MAQSSYSSSDAVYICNNGHRHARPDFHDFLSGVKARWKGRSILDVFCGDFDSQSRGYFTKAIEIGAITSRGKRVPKEHVLGDNDRLVHRIHRHEPPVTCAAIADVPVIIDPDHASVLRGLRAVWKPGGIPVHGCGPYHRLTIVSLLADAEKRPASSYHTLHRLDRLTHGVLLLTQGEGAKETAAAVSKQIRDGLVEKRYVALVKGVFPLCPSPPTVDSPCSTPLAPQPACPWLTAFVPSPVRTYWADEEGVEQQGETAAPVAGSKRKRDVEEESDSSTATPALTWTPSGHLRISVPCTTIDGKNAVQGVWEGSKEEHSEPVRDSVSLFRCLGYKDGSSLVECVPLSGRTHQLRVHLAHVGYPIMDDLLYCKDAAERVRKGQEVAVHTGSSSSALPACELAGLDLCSSGSKSRHGGEDESIPDIVSPGTGQAEDSAILALCPNCRLGPAAFFTPLQLCATQGISLASVSYRGVGWAVAAPHPAWASGYMLPQGS